MYSMTGKIICDDCGGCYGRNNQHSTTYGDLVWHCRNRYKNNCKTPRLYNYILNETLDRLLPKLLTDDLIKTLEDILGVKDIKLNIKTKLSDWDFIIKEIVVTKDWKLKIRLIDGREYVLKHRKNTPRAKKSRL